jgi:hypothetical protein
MEAIVEKRVSHLEEYLSRALCRWLTLSDVHLTSNVVLEPRHWPATFVLRSSERTVAIECVSKRAESVCWEISKRRDYDLLQSGSVDAVIRFRGQDLYHEHCADNCVALLALLEPKFFDDRSTRNILSQAAPTVRNLDLGPGNLFFDAPLSWEDEHGEMRERTIVVIRRTRLTLRRPEPLPATFLPGWLEEVRTFRAPGSTRPIASPRHATPGGRRS